MMKSKSLLCTAGAAFAALMLGSAPAGATVVAPVVLDPQIFIQQSGSSPAGGDPNLITDTSAFVAGVAGNHTLQDPLLVIVGAYNGTGGTPSISFSGCATPSACSAATVGTYGLTANTATYTSSSTGTAFAQLGLGAGGSESFGNWSGADVANGFAAPTSFGLYAFAVPTSLAGGSPITIDESGAANGSFIIAYDCETGTGSSSGCATPGDRGQTVFTNTGLVDAGGTPPVPEPSTLALFGVGLLGLGVVRRFRPRN